MSITPILKTGFDYGKRIVNVTPELLYGLTGGGKATTEVLGNAMLNGYRNGGMFNAAKAGWQTLEGAVPKNVSFGTRIWNGTVNGFNSVKSGFANFGHNWSVGSRAARMAGKSQLLGGLKAGLKGFSKAVPFLGTALLVAYELPNIFTAVKEKGLWQGVKETAKAGTKLCGAAGGAAAGAAIGSAICPGIGTAIGGLIGWLGGEWLAGKVTGKTYTEEKEEQQQQIAQAQEQMAEQQAQMAQAYQSAATAANPFAGAYTANPFANSALDYKYADDIFAPKFG